MKTKYKSNSEHNLAFRIAVFLCLCGIAFCSYLFYKNFFRSLTKLNEAPIATITFKKKVAQRKFIDRVVWDRLQQNSPIYNGDTVRTAELSGALVSFASGAVLELEENTLAQFFQNDDGSFSANLGGGSFTAQAAEDGSVLSVSSGGQTLSMSQGASLFMQQQENGVQLNILSGSASFADGASIEEGEALSMDENGYTFSPLKVTSPAPSAKILYISKNNQGTHPVRFAWRKSEDYTNLFLTISKDSLYENVLRRFNVSRFTEYTVPLSSGSYYWKFEDEANTLVSRGKITLSQTYLPKITSPVNNARYEYSSSFPEIKFAWEGIEDARSYYVTIANNQTLEDPIVDRIVASPYLSISNLSDGTYYWQVSPTYSTRVQGGQSSSTVRKFTISKVQNTLVSPTLLIPKDESFVKKNQSKGIRFSWKGEKDAYAYRICISKNADLRNPIVNEVLKNTFFTADANLQSGKYYWAVWQQDERGVESERSALYSFIADEIAIEQRTVFPSDNYTVWEDLIQEIKFSWKTNVPTVHTLQISKDESFSNIIFEKKIDTTSYSGLPLASGTYWWRVKASNENVEYATKAKKLNVVSSFPKVDFVSPLSENPTVVKTKNPYTFRWKEISGADYYNITIYDQNGQDSLFMGTGLSSPEFAVNFQNTELGEYRVIVQSYARETTSSTRLQGLHSSLSFRLVNPQVERPKAEPLPLFASPLNLQTDAKVYNADSLRQKPSITFSWNAVSGANAYVLSIRNAQGGQVFTRTTSATSYELKDLTVLSKGKFTWTVKAVTRRAGNITRNGREARSDFSVDFTLTGTQLIDTGKLYGQ